MYYIRADANGQTGAGHMMRCLTIAKALSARLASGEGDSAPEADDSAPEADGSAPEADGSAPGAGGSVPGTDGSVPGSGGTGGSAEARADGEVTAAYGTGHPLVVFLCADEDSAVLPRRAGFAVRVLGTDYRNMESELPVLTVLFAQADTAPSGRHTVLVDSYHVTDAYLAVLRAFCRVILIDDNMERTYPADVILNYNFHADADAYRALYLYGDADVQTAGEEAAWDGTKDSRSANIPGTRVFTGPQFAPVREQFTDRAYRVREQTEQILILAGGSDPSNAAGEIYRVLRETMCATDGNDITNIDKRNNEPQKDAPRFTIVCGRYNAHAAALDALAGQDDSLRVLHDVEDMASLMCESDLCISACGSTLYELCAVGLPFVCYTLADNQLKLAAYLDANGPVPCAGAFHLDSGQTLSAIAKHAAYLADNYEARLSQCNAQRMLVDGEGARRIAGMILTSC